MSNLKHEVTAEHWTILIKERMNSGMTVKEWCRERNIKESQYYYWLKTLRRDEAHRMEQKRQTPPFVELPAVCQEQNFQRDRAAAIIRKGGYFYRNNGIRPVRFYCKSYGGGSQCLVM